MTDDEQRRLEKIRGSDRYFSEKLSYADLCLLLTHDQVLRELVLAATTINRHEPALPFNQEMQVPIDKRRREIKPVAAAVPLHIELEKQLNMLAILKQDIELQTLWLGQSTATNQSPLVKVIAISANWDRILELWDIIAARCKKTANPANTAEMTILFGAIDIHNHIWQGTAVTVNHAVVGGKYDFNTQTRINNGGEVVLIELLPGICNAAGEQQRKPLIIAK
jgi:hypothetical protein